MSQDIWGETESAFWTSDDERDGGDDSETVVSPSDSALKEGTITPPDWLQQFEDERAKLEDVVGLAEGFSTEAPAIPENAVALPEEKKRFIRKKWVIEDKRDMNDFHSILPEAERAMLHPFELDPFQKRSILHIENHEHVFVCAHTSAGKTVIAEYAIALAAKNNMRAIYTSPIKALSNQKFREFCNIFPSVGIITGDVSVNTQAQCLIMTTEILRSLLYRGDQLLSQLACVIFDEVHYVNDPDRGVVWEETIIMLPPQVTMVMLSATVPNYLQFAEWIGTTKEREVFAISTSHRPTPLQHYMWANDKAYLLMDSRGQFNSGVYNLVYNDARAAAKAKEVRAQAKAKGKAKAKAQFSSSKSKSQSLDARAKTERQKLQKFIEFLQQKEGLPAVCFCFSRKRCEEFAYNLPDIIQVPAEIKSKIHVFVKQALVGLSEDDRQLPQIRFVENLVKRGIGVHHGGLLPIVKEMVEILFSRGLVQVLFATETFAMGVNMPARSVLFTAVRKHDGRRNRALESSEYIQIAGRAGRRGLDKCGNVYIFVPGDELPNHLELVTMMTFKATPLQSKFRLTFHMLLQLITRQGMRPIEMLSSSFRESVRAHRLPVLKRDLVRKRKELSELPQPDCIFGLEAVQDYVELELSSRQLGYKLHQTLWESKYAHEVFCPGRLALVHTLPFSAVSCYGVILSWDSQFRDSGADSPTDYTQQFFRGQVQHSNAAADQPQRLDEDPTFTMLLLVPRCIKLTDAVRSDENTVKAAPLDPLVKEAQAMLEEKLHYKADDIVIAHIGDVGAATQGMSAAAIQEEDVRAALSADGSNYVSARQFVVARKVPLSAIGSLLLDELKLPPLTSWSSDSQYANVTGQMDDDDEDFPGLGGPSEPSLAGSKKASKRVATQAASQLTAQEERQLWWIRIAHLVDDELKQRKGQVTAFAIPKKMKHIEVEHVVDATRLRGIAQRIINHRCHLDPKRDHNVALQLKRRRLQKEIEAVEFTISESSLDLVPDMMARIDVLKARQFISQNGSIALKGRAACEVVATDEITLIEAMFEHVFQAQDPEVIVAAVSAFVFPESNDDEEIIFNEEFEAIKEWIDRTHTQIGEELVARGIRLDWEDWKKLCNFRFAQIAWRWARGEPFTSLIEKTSLQEGTIVRTIIRLDELIRKLRSVAHLIGNQELKAVLGKASELIHRDIVFASSLYLQ